MSLVWLYLALSAQSVSEAVGKGHGVGREAEGVAAVTAALAAKGDVNERDKTGWTPLMYACLECRPKIVKLLVERGADVNHRANGDRRTSYLDHGQSPLHVAASCFMARRRASIAPQRGMPQSYVQQELDAPLAIVRLLIAQGVNVNAQDADGRTPLMMAAMHGWQDVVAELLAAKAKPDMRDLEGRSAIDYAVPSLRRLFGSLPPSGRSGRTVCDAEAALDKLGYNTPIIDCIWGQQLSAVVAKFQKDRQLTPSGELDADTRKALKIE